MNAIRLICGWTRGAFALAAVLALTPALLHAQGSVSGRVTDGYFNLALEGVRVRVADTGLTTATDSSGTFTLRNVPSGTRTMTFEFLGYQPISQEVEVTSAGVRNLEIVMGDGEVIAMEEFVISAQAIGQARALNIQRTNDNLTNIVAADAIGQFPDQNAAEALARLPGISVDTDQGEGRYVIIRGIDPELSNFQVNGMSLASPRDSERAALLDIIPSDVLAQLEVTKAVLPEQPADAIGGTINIRLPSAFDSDEMILKANIQGNYFDITEDLTPHFNVDFGQQFGDNNQFGLYLAISYDERSYGSDNQEADAWDFVDSVDPDDGNEYLFTEEYQYREYTLTRERIGISLNLEFRPNEFNRYYVQGFWNQYEDHEYRQRTDIGLDPDNATQIRETSGIVEDAEIGTRLKDRTETLSNWGIQLGGENEMDRITLDYFVGYSFADEDTPDDYETEYVLPNEDTTIIYNNVGTYHPQLTYGGAGDDLRDPAAYEFDGLEDADQIVEEDHFEAAANLRFDLDFADETYIKTGFRIRTKEKTNDVEVFKSDDNPAEVDTLDGLAGAGRDSFGAEFPVIAFGYGDIFAAQESAFAMERDFVDSVVEDWESSEDVYAGYVQGKFQSGPFSVLGGLRVEHTEFEAQGNLVDADAETLEGRIIAAKDDTEWLPGVHFRYDATNALVLRAAFTRTLARPSFEATRAGAAVDGDEIELGNPDLDLTTSENFDISAEYYLNNIGLVSMSFFYKDINNPVYEVGVEGAAIAAYLSDIGIPNLDTFYNANDDSELTSFLNGEEGSVFGIELAYQQQFTFLPGPFDGLGFLANLTWSDSDGTLPAAPFVALGETPREVNLRRHSEVVGNIAVTYEKGGFFIRLAGNFRSDYLDEVGDIFDRTRDRYIDDAFRVDLTTSYDITDNFTVFLNVINLTNEPFRAYFDGTEGLSQFEEYGWNAQFGLKWRL